MRMPKERKSPLAALTQGLAAGAVGTAVVTLYQHLTSGGGHDREPRTWSEAPEPAQVGQRVAHGVFERPVPLEKAGLLTQVVHWAYGTGWGALYGVLEESIRKPVVSGVALTGAVLTTDYTLLPAMRLYEPPWRYPPKRLATDLATHLVHGLATATAYRALDHGLDRRR